MEWGLLGGERLGGTRRVRTLGMGATVRFFNEQAVPGLGGVWFGRQVVLALLGIHIGESLRADGRGSANILAANAVEAFAVWSTLTRNKWSRDPRLPGYLKLQLYSKREDPTFKHAGSRAFYVSQPMRIGTRDALPMLGLVSATNRRFNSYALTERGVALLEATCPRARTALLPWAKGGSLPVRRKAILEELDPTRPLSDSAREILREAFISGPEPERSRRREALAFVEELGPGGHTSWDEQPAGIIDATHWADMRAGAVFASVMEAAAGEEAGGSVLRRIEARMGSAGIRKLALSDAVEVALIPAIDRLRERAGAFLFTGHDPSPGRAASQFCTDCVEADDQLLISRLVARDGRILRLIDSSILAGSAFEGQPLSEPDLDDTAVAILDESLDEPPEEGIPPLPESISRRIHNLATLAPDLRAATGDVEGL
ncbi:MULTISPECIES: hypothetical protein [Methylobacterium]|jgi:hypothetical protein|uniref:hypothetical protein n=1 Tax=Methylobacterium TaxID=407 RepID=UPI000AE6776D|nr:MULTISPECIES: hypothetical protein [Methylobacterium]MCI9882183.1 hypothetical protein [Methylobacterium goesingense]